MNFYPKQLSAALLSLVLVTTLAGPSYAADLSFRDVPEDYWGVSPIHWAIDNEVVEGYPDGSFRPAQAVSRSEFLAMLVRAYRLDDDRADKAASSRWDAPYLAIANSLNWKVDAADSVFNRGKAAILVANAAGKNYSMDSSIQYLLDTDLANGRKKRTVDGFDKNQVLTRAEAVALIERLTQQVSKPDAIAVNEQPYDRSENVVVYKNRELHFELTLPISWEGKFKVESRPVFGNSIEFINAATGTGRLFTLSVCSASYWTEKEDEIQGQIPAVKVGEYENLAYIFHTPTDVQYDPSDTAAAEDYLKMYKDVERIKSTFEIVK